MSQEDNYAFPFDCNFTQYTGMTLRDYFAAKAMQSLWHDPEIAHTATVRKVVANLAYEIADAMLEARK